MCQEMLVQYRTSTTEVLLQVLLNVMLPSVDIVEYKLEENEILTNSVSSKFVEHTTLSNSFKGWTSQDTVDSFSQEVTEAQV